MGTAIFLCILGIAGIVLAVYLIKKQFDTNKQIDQKIDDTGFVTSRRVASNGMALYVDERNKKWFIKSDPYDDNPKIYHYSDLIEFEVYENGGSIAKGRAGSALVGGLLFGGVGAVVGAARSRNYESVCDSLQLRVRVKDIQCPEIAVKFIRSKVEKSSFAYKNAFESAKEFAALLSYIQNGKEVKAEPEPQQQTPAPPPSQAEELKKFHDLMKQGVITEAEFQAKKREILGE